MDIKRTRLIRTELYEKVWATPMLQLAQEFGISDVGLAKLCRRHNIPLPGLGYWRKRETGHDPGRVPLPPASNQTMVLIEIIASQKPEDIKALLADQAQKAFWSRRMERAGIYWSRQVRFRGPSNFSTLSCKLARHNTIHSTGLKRWIPN